MTDLKEYFDFKSVSATSLENDFNTIISDVTNTIDSIVKLGNFFVYTKLI